MEPSDYLYNEHDKIVYVRTGHVLTVHADLSNHLSPGIIVKEKIGRLLDRQDVRPAGRTREWFDAAKGIVPPEPPPPIPASRLCEIS